MRQITIEVPDELGEQIESHRDRLPEILERGLRELLAERTGKFQDEQEIMAVLASQPTPEEVLAIEPSHELQVRVRELLEKNKRTQLSSSEEAELERYLTLEHLVRLAKAHAADRQN